MKKIYVIGSSSKISPSIEKLVGNDSEVVFYGRANPQKLKKFIRYDGIFDEESVDTLGEMISRDIDNTKSIDSVALVVLAGISSKKWGESYLINEYLPARLSELFAEKISATNELKASITLVSSSAAYQGAKLPYATTKASLTGILHTIARDYQGKIRINIILPSAFDSGMIADWDNEKRKKVAADNYVGRLGSPADIADAIMFSINNNFITNSVINMTGGTIHI